MWRTVVLMAALVAAAGGGRRGLAQDSAPPRFRFNYQRTEAAAQRDAAEDALPARRQSGRSTRASSAQQGPAEDGSPPRTVVVDVTVIETAEKELPAELTRGGASEAVAARVAKLEKQGRFEVLTRARLTTVESQKATVHIGETASVGRSIAVFGGDRGDARGRLRERLSRSVSQQNTGTIVSVTPRIAGDGAVVAEVNFEKTRLRRTSDDRDADEGESGGSGSPETVTLTAQGTVGVAAGRTAVLSGVQIGGGRSSQVVILVSAEASAGGAGSSAAAAPREEEFSIFKLQHANAEEILRIVGELQLDEPLRIAADARTNSLIVRGTREQLSVIEALIQRLDEQID